MANHYLMAPQKNNQTVLLIATLIIIVGFAAGYFYYSQWVVPSVSPIEPPMTGARDDLKAFENLRIDFSILDNNKYKALQIFGESPVNPGVTGKKDLFAPI